MPSLPDHPVWTPRAQHIKNSLTCSLMPGVNIASGFLCREISSNALKLNLCFNAKCDVMFCPWGSGLEVRDVRYIITVKCGAVTAFSETFTAERCLTFVPYIPLFQEQLEEKFQDSSGDEDLHLKLPEHWKSLCFMKWGRWGCVFWWRRWKHFIWGP